MASPARGPAPIDSSTWLGFTLPDEQAEPALIATPAMSNAITIVSAAFPDAAIQLVLPSRGASRPNTAIPLR